MLVTPSNVASLVNGCLHPIVDSDVFTCIISKSDRLADLRLAIEKAALASSNTTRPPIPPHTHQRLILLNDTSASILHDSSALLGSFDLYPGRVIYIESTLDAELLRPTFDRLRCSIEICYNLPENTLTAPDSRPMQPEYNQKLRVSRNDTLGSVKSKLAAALALDPTQFRIARTHTAPQFKDEEQTLAELQIVDQSGIYVALGRPLKKEEVQVSVFLLSHSDGDEPPNPTSTVVSASESSATPAPPSTGTRFQFLFSLPLRSDILVSDLKVLLLDFLSKKRPHPTIAGSNGFGIAHIRIRDKKGASSSKVYEDTRTLSENAAGGPVKLDDGFEICIQRLEQPEVWTRDKMMLQLQQWRPETQKLGPIQDLVTKKNISVGGMKRQLYQMIQPAKSEESINSESVSADGGTHGDTSLIDSASLAPSTDGIDLSLSSASIASSSSVVAPPSLSPAPPILVAKGKLTGRMKRADMARLTWSGGDGEGGDSKLLRNAINIRPGELMIFRVEITEEQRAHIAAQAKANKAKQQAEPTDDNKLDSSTPTAGTPSKPNSSALRKPWQRSGGTTSSGLLSRTRKSAAPGVSVASRDRPALKERALVIGWADDEWIEAEKVAAAAEAEVDTRQKQTANENENENQV